MGHRLDKNMKIMHELISFCTKREARELDMNIRFDKEVTFIKVSASDVVVSDDDLKVLKNAIYSDRQHEVEECFWNISGEDYLGDELTLAGVMIDGGKVSYENNILEINVKRKED